MNCPWCSSPLLFGATSCPCGYNPASSPSDELPIELSYGESLRAFWRIYWPTQVLGLVAFFAFAMVYQPTELDTASNLLAIALQVAIVAVGLFLFVPRICSRPYRGFSLLVVELASGGTTRRLRPERRGRVCLFLWWRQILAGMISTLLAMPLNMVLSIMGLHLAQWVSTFAGVLVVGPILLKMLIGYQFDDFRLEARRP
jgi:hypothetical protein